MKYVQWLMGIALLTASCDVVLAFNLLGTIRLAQVAMFLIIFCALGRILQEKVILWPRGGYALALWCLIQGLLITQSSAQIVSIELYVLLLFTIVSIYAVLQLYGRSSLAGPLMRIYLISYVVVAAFGAIQFVAPILHLGAPLVQQWIVQGILPRINGFSYEPSYFATYLIMGWIMLIDLRQSKARVTSEPRWFWYLLLVSLVLFLSTSKTAWLLMMAEGIARFVPAIRRIAGRTWTRLREGRLVIPTAGITMLFWFGVFLVATVAFLAAVGRFVDLNRFLSGTGINGTAAHSVNDRVNGFKGTWIVIQQHFWIGRSLGGVSGALAALYGQSVHNVQDLHIFWGYPVPLDVFAASGFWGIIPFVWFFWAITRGEKELIRQHWHDERAKWLRALIRALVFEWIALCADQNLLRVYLWFHVTMVVVIGYNLRYAGDRHVPSEALAV